VVCGSQLNMPASCSMVTPGAWPLRPSCPALAGSMRILAGITRSEWPGRRNRRAHRRRRSGSDLTLCESPASILGVPFAGHHAAVRPDMPLQAITGPPASNEAYHGLLCGSSFGRSKSAAALGRCALSGAGSRTVHGSPIRPVRL
jgi:hypothetical protein